MIGRNLLHYTIESELGAGGMGRVFLARDTRTDRRVALKFLAGAGDAESRARFLREARAAARLSHPGIVTLFAVEETPDGPFLVQEFVEGETLARRLARGPLGTRETLRLARELSDALAHAHRNGVLHRDLKPDNVLMAADGSAKIADFGIARIEGAATLTEAGTLIGTLPYMAPERLAGNAGDARGDLFALGAILYEAISGRRAFPGASESAVMYGVANEDPPVPTVSGALQPLVPIVMKMLAKSPADRPASAEVVRGVFEMLAMAAPGSGAIAPTQATTQPLPSAVTLEAEAATTRTRARAPIVPIAIGVAVALALAAGAWMLRGRIVPEAAAESPAIAVLYFENVTDPADSGRMGPITGNLLVTALAQAPDVSVLSSQRIVDAMRAVGMRGDQFDPAKALAVARRVRATRVITGRILQTTPAIVMTAEVVDVVSGRVVHAERVEGQPGQTVFQIVDQLGPRLLAGMLRRDRNAMSLPSLASRTSASLTAQLHYAAGQDHFAHARFDSAEARYSAAIAEDATFAQAHYQLAIVQWWGRERVETERSLEAARAASDRLSPLEREVLEGVAELSHQNWSAARRRFDALAADHPDEKLVRYGQLEATFHSGDHVAAIDAARAALAIDGGFAVAAIHLVNSLGSLGRPAEAEQVAREFLRSGPAPEQILDGVWHAHLMAGNTEAALAWARMLRARGSVSPTLAAAVVAFELAHAPDSAAVWFAMAEPNLGQDEWPRIAAYAAATREGRMRDALAISDRSWHAVRDRGFNVPLLPPIATGVFPAIAIGGDELLVRRTARAREALVKWVGLEGFGAVMAVAQVHGLLERGRVADADSLLAPLEVRLANNPEIASRLAYGRALVLGSQGRTDEAMAKLRASVWWMNPWYESGSRRVDAAVILQRGGRHAEAIAHLDSAAACPALPIEWVPRLPLLRARSLEALGRHAEALPLVDAWLAAHARADRDLLDLAEARAMKARLEKATRAAAATP